LPRKRHRATVPAIDRGNLPLLHWDEKLAKTLNDQESDPELWPIEFDDPRSRR
jgi:hypothetical protein